MMGCSGEVRPGMFAMPMTPQVASHQTGKLFTIGEGGEPGMSFKEFSK